MYRTTPDIMADKKQLFKVFREKDTEHTSYPYLSAVNYSMEDVSVTTKPLTSWVCKEHRQL